MCQSLSVKAMLQTDDRTRTEAAPRNKGRNDAAQAAQQRRNALRSSAVAVARLLLLLFTLPLVALYALAALARRLLRRSTKRAAATGHVNVIAPYPPGNRSGGAKAIQGLLQTLERRFTVNVIRIYQLTPPPRWRKFVGDALTQALPMPVHCRPFIAAPRLVLRHVPRTGPLLVEFVSGAMCLYFGRRPRQLTMLRDHEPLALRLLSEKKQAQGWNRIVLPLKIAIAYCITAKIYLTVDQIITLTPEDATFIRRAYPWLPTPVTCIPVTIDPEASSVARAALARPSELLFVGNLFHRPNLDGLFWFLTECAPHLPAGFTLHLCGLDQPLEHFFLPQTMNVVRHGFVEDIDKEIPGAGIAVAPIISGAGVRIKNLFLAAKQKAIVTTPLGNQGVDFVPGVEVVICGDGQAMARAITELAQEPDRIGALGRRAFEKVMMQFGPAATADRYQKLLERG
jgi:glycosyltransferase involved in cell wall biosynthesis